MMTDDIAAVEADLRQVFTVAAATIPEVPPLGWDEYRSSFPKSTKTRRPVGRPARLAIVGTAALGIAGAGTGIAAAVGAFSVFNPTKVTYGSARTLLPPKGYVPGEVTRYSGPGPAGTTLTVVSASSESNSGCIGLIISAPTAPSSNHAVTGSCMASGNVRQPQATRANASTTEYDHAEYWWTSPTGNSYVIWYGKAPAGTVAFGEVGLVTGNGPRPILGPKQQATNGFYALAIPRHPGDAVGFYNADGDVIATTGGTLGHGP